MVVGGCTLIQQLHTLFNKKMFYQFSFLIIIYQLASLATRVVAIPGRVLSKVAEEEKQTGNLQYNGKYLIHGDIHSS